MAIDRKVLLPPYMADVQVWRDLSDIIDKVMKPNVDDPTKWLAQVRYLWIQTEAGMEKIEQGLMVDTNDFEIPEKEILVRQATQMGLDFRNSDLLSSEDYQRIVRNLSQFWFSKGKPSFIDFLGFVLNSVLDVKNLWSTTGSAWNVYGTMLPEGDPGIGTPVWQGGTWFPTTHVQVSFDPFTFAAPSFEKLINFFYSVANFNLVIDSVLLEGILHIHSVDEIELARVAVAYPIIEISMTIETV